MELASFYVNFIDYEKAFDGDDRAAMWQIIRHYGTPDKFISFTKATYQGMSCRVVHGCQLSE